MAPGSYSQIENQLEFRMPSSALLGLLAKSRAPKSLLQTPWTLFYFLLIIPQLTTLIASYWDYIPSDVINKHCNEDELLSWFHYFISILKYRIHYTSRTATHRRYLLTHSTAPLRRCTSEKRGATGSTGGGKKWSFSKVQWWHATRSWPARWDTPVLLHSAEEELLSQLSSAKNLEQSFGEKNHLIKTSQYHTDPEG